MHRLSHRKTKVFVLLLENLTKICSTKLMHKTNVTQMGGGWTEPDRHKWNEKRKGKSVGKVAKGSSFCSVYYTPPFSWFWQPSVPSGRRAGRRWNGTRSADTGAQKTGGRGGGNKEYQNITNVTNRHYVVCYLGCPSVVSHTRNPLCTLSGVAAVTVSSSSSRKSSPRWQFWRRSQPPSVMLLANSLRAWTSWPCPMEMGRHGAPCRRRAEHRQPSFASIKSF